MRERGVTKKEPQNIWFWCKLKQNLVFVFHLVKCSYSNFSIKLHYYSIALNIPTRAINLGLWNAVLKYFQKKITLEDIKVFWILTRPNPVPCIFKTKIVCFLLTCYLHQRCINKKQKTLYLYTTVNCIIICDFLKYKRSKKRTRQEEKKKLMYWNKFINVRDTDKNRITASFKVHLFILKKVTKNLFNYSKQCHW